MTNFDQDLQIQLHDVAPTRRTRFDRWARAYGLTRAQGVILARLHRQPGLSQIELAAICEVEAITVARLVDRLEARGLIERRPDPNDRRINRVMLTRKGNQVLDRMAKIGMDMNAKVMRGISLERQHMLAVTLHDMKKNLIALDTVPGSRPKARSED